MKKIYCKFCILVMLIVVGCSTQPKEIEGVWYGLSDGALIEVSINADGTMSLDSEASSNLSFVAKYTLDESVSPTKINIMLSSDMAGAGLVRLKDDGALDMNLLFGVPGMVVAPENFDPVPMNPANVRLHLVRDKEPLLAEVERRVEIPAEAQLAFERNRRLGAGINLNAVVDGNLHPGYERDAPLADEEIRSIAEAGFRSVRLNVTWSKHCQKEYPYTIDPAFLRKVDHIVDECIKNDLAVSIDVHYYPYINMSNTDPDISMVDNYKRLGCLWEQIAEHYKEYSNDMLFFDLLNEPNLVMGTDVWNQLSAELIKIVRKSNPERTLLISTPSLGQSWTLGSLKLPEDDWNLIAQFHYYLPHTFTHQGLSYAMAGDSQGVEWHGTAEEKAIILKDLDYCKRWSEKNGRPVNMGEYGVVNTADEASRARYLGFMQEVVRERDISSHLWGYREIFMIRDENTGEWNKSIIDAMKLK